MCSLCITTERQARRINARQSILLWLRYIIELLAFELLLLDMKLHSLKVTSEAGNPERGLSYKKQHY